MIFFDAFLFPGQVISPKTLSCYKPMFGLNIKKKKMLQTHKNGFSNFFCNVIILQAAFSEEETNLIEHWWFDPTHH